MTRFREKWVLLRKNPPEYHESTGNSRPVPPSEIQCRGMLQQRQLSASSVDAGNTEISESHIAGSFMLLLDPVCDGIRIPVPEPTDYLRGPDGFRYDVVVARPRPAPPAKANYIAVIVKSSSDMKGSIHG